jgi:hypothetical protein
VGRRPLFSLVFNCQLAAKIYTVRFFQ